MINIPKEYPSLTTDMLDYIRVALDSHQDLDSVILSDCWPHAYMPEHVTAEIYSDLQTLLEQGYTKAVTYLESKLEVADVRDAVLVTAINDSDTVHYQIHRLVPIEGVLNAVYAADFKPATIGLKSIDQCRFQEVANSTQYLKHISVQVNTGAAVLYYRH